MLIFSFFFFNDTATTEIYTLSLHDALPILLRGSLQLQLFEVRLGIPGLKGHRLEDGLERAGVLAVLGAVDRKSTRLNSSHSQISYAVFCLKKKKKKTDVHDV